MLGQNLLGPYLPRDLADLVCGYIRDGIDAALVAHPKFWPRELARRMRALLAEYVPRVDIDALCAALQKDRAVVSGSLVLHMLAPFEKLPPNDVDIFVEGESDRAIRKFNPWSEVTGRRGAPNVCHMLAEHFLCRKELGQEKPNTNEHSLVIYPLGALNRVYEFDSYDSKRVQVCCLAEDPSETKLASFDYDILRNWFDGKRVHITFPALVRAREVTVASVPKCNMNYNYTAGVMRLVKYHQRGMLVRAPHQKWHQYDNEARPLCEECCAKLLYPRDAPESYKRPDGSFDWARLQTP